MKKKNILLTTTVLACGICFATAEASAQSYFENYANQNLSTAKQAKSAKQRVASNQIRRNHSFSDMLKEYNNFKNKLSKNYGFDFGADVSFMGQRGAPGGSKTAFQTIIAPYFTWQNFSNEYGTGTLNFAYNITRYNGGIDANELGNRIGIATPMNDFPDTSTSFDELYYSYQLGGNWNWLTLNFGQFPIYNFDGSANNSNQQVNFINYALSQNASSTYSLAGVGTFVQIQPSSNWTFVVGAQDATNVNATSVRVNNFGQKHYTTFGSASYTPTINNLGAGQYSILLYNQPSVEEQEETTNGWSLNLSQDLGEKWNVFGRINGVTGHIAEVSQSYVLGATYNNPLERNPLDQIGVAFAFNKIDPIAVGEPTDHKYEKVIEAYWAWGVSKWMTITPDIQFYIDPALNPKSDYDTVFSLRTTLFF